MSSLQTPSPDMLACKFFSAHTMAARAPVTPLISVCPSSNGSSTRGTKVSLGLSPTTPDRLSCIVSYSSKGICMGLGASSEHGPSTSCPTVPFRFRPNPSSLWLGKPSPCMGHTRCAVLPLVAIHAFLRTQELLMVQASHFVLGAPGVWCCSHFLPPNQVSASKTPQKRRSSVRTSAQWCPSFDQANGFGRKAQLRFQILFNVPTLVCLPSAGGHTHCDVEGSQRTFWNTARQTAIRRRWPSTKLPGFTSTRQCPRWRRPRSPPFNKRPSTNMPKVSRLQHPNARGGRARFPCSGSCRQWRLQ